MRFPDLVPARFVSRPNRFLIRARVRGRELDLACADPGRLDTVLRPGAVLRVSVESGPGRRTAGTVRLVRHGRTWVSLVPALANRLFEAAVAAGTIDDLAGCRVLRREVPVDRSRFDFRLSVGGRPALVEVKSVGRVQGATAVFPDAPSARGLRHVRTLAARARRGHAAWVVFVVQRSDALRVRPWAARDPDLAEALADAARAGVELRGYACGVDESGARIERSVPVVL